MFSVGAALAPTEHYGFDFNYSFSDVYISTNACYLSGAYTTLPGAASLNAAGQPNLCPNLATDWGPVKDYMVAPTQYLSVALALSPVKAIHSDIGYRVSAVSGNQFFNDAQEVNGSLQSRVSNPVPGCGVDGEARVDLESRVELLWLRRNRRQHGRSFLQYVDADDLGGCSLQHAYHDGDDR